MPRVTFEKDAGSYTVPEAVDRFVPPLVWDRIRQPGNQLLYGCAGAGKTMLLKRISWPGMLTAPAYGEAGEFIAFYCDVRDLEILTPLFDPKLLGTLARPIVPLAHATLLANAHILHCIADTLIETKDLANATVHGALTEALLEVVPLCFYSLTPPRLTSLEEVLRFLGMFKAKMITGIHVPAVVEQFFESTPQVPSPEHVLRALVLHLKASGGAPPVGLLLDQYDSLPPDCQAILNPLARRENRPNLFTVIACRPFAFNTKANPVALQPGEDFSFTIAEYFPSSRRLYTDLLEDIWNQIRPDGPEIGSLLQGGHQYLADLSSRSIRRFLELCDACGALSATSSHIILRREQQRAAERISTIFRDQLKLTSDVELGSLWTLVLRLTKMGKARRPGPHKIPYQLQLRADSLFGFEELNEPAVRLVKKGFEEGVFQFVTESDGSSLSLPSRFALAPVVGPVLQGTVDASLTASMSLAEIEGIAKGPPKRGAKPKVDLIQDLRRVFLSTSFQDLPDPRQARKEFARVFANHDVELVEGSGLGPGAIGQIAEQIRESDLTILDISSLRPNVILEMGLTLGLRKRIVPVLNRNGRGSGTPTDYPFLTDMGYLPYDLSEESLRRLLIKVREWAAKPISDTHLLDKTLDGGVRLRVQQRSRHVALYYPQSRSALWSAMRGEILAKASARGFRLLEITEGPHPQGLDLFDNLVWAISIADRVIVDTSGDTEPDLYGSFAIGFSFAISQIGKKKQILRLEEDHRDHEGGLSMWPSTYYRKWSNQERLVQVVGKFLPEKRRRKGRRR